MLLETRPHSNDLSPRMDRHRDPPSTLAQGGLQLLQDQHVAGQIGQAPLEFKRVFQTAQIARRVMHIGLLHLDIMQTDQGV